MLSNHVDILYAIKQNLAQSQNVNPKIICNIKQWT